VALRDLRVRDDAWARMDPAHADEHQRLWTGVVRRAQPGYVAASAALLALARCRQPQGMARRELTICPRLDTIASREGTGHGRLLRASLSVIRGSRPRGLHRYLA